MLWYTLWSLEVGVAADVRCACARVSEGVYQAVVVTKQAGRVQPRRMLGGSGLLIADPNACVFLRRERPSPVHT